MVNYQTNRFDCKEKGCNGTTQYSGWYCNMHNPGICGNGDDCYCVCCYMTEIIEVNKRFEKVYGYIPEQPIYCYRVCICCGFRGQLSKCFFRGFVYNSGWKQCLKGLCCNCYSENFSKAIYPIRLKGRVLSEQSLPKRVRFNV